MKHIKEDELHKEKFQLERIALFSDAVFAIAITLLIIEIKVPEIHGDAVSDSMLFHSLLSIAPKFCGFLVSFLVIGLYWLSHHRLFRYVIRANQKLLFNNLLFLLPIVIMPFSTAFLTEFYTGNVRLPLAIYTLNICVSGFFIYRLWKIVSNVKYHLSVNLNKAITGYNIARALTTPIVFICLFLLSFISLWLSYLILPFMPLASRFINRYYYKRYPEDMSKHLE